MYFTHSGAVGGALMCDVQKKHERKSICYETEQGQRGVSDVAVFDCFKIKRCCNPCALHIPSFN